MRFAIPVAMLMIPLMQVPVAKKMDRSLLRPSIKAPSLEIITKLASGKKFKEAYTLAGPASIGGTGFIAVVTYGTKGGKKLETGVLKLIAIEFNSGKWKKRWIITLLAGNKARLKSCQIRAKIKVDDYDYDNKPEAFITYNYCGGMQRGLGSDKITEVIIVNIGTVPSIAFEDEIKRIHGSTELGIKKGVLTFRDINGDGHPDIIINYTTIIKDTEDTDRTETIEEIAKYLWDIKTDRYKLFKEQPAE